MQEHRYVIGIDIGGTTTSFGFADCRGNLLLATTIPTPARQPAEVLVTTLCDVIEQQRTKLPPQSCLCGIGIGAPNANYRRGTVENPPNLDWGASVNLVELFRSRYDLLVTINNDANAAALGELLFGAARGMKHCIVITLGTGLGSGIIVNGELLYGASGFAGELGHTTVEPEGRFCACGKQGCLEAYVSATGLCRTAAILLAQRCEPSRLRITPFNELTGKLVCDAAGEGDAIALAACDATARVLGMKLADAVAHLSPEAIILTGGLAEAGDLLLVPTQRYLEQFLFSPYKGNVRIIRSGLPGGNGALLGAAALIWHELSATANDGTPPA